ncbi:galactose-3-O-sulfotransferase 2-like [Patella vulgata]|uniref:galactose-3-O-sulfotransferase 2-like n=1 Tax=Patella vulgata TaxID=6465 RepID=UPI0024A9082A|nr:galactose-3-O-sulfotransferase 2-like [Patella vulgata]
MFISNTIYNTKSPFNTRHPYSQNTNKSHDLHLTDYEIKPEVTTGSHKLTGYAQDINSINCLPIQNIAFLKVHKCGSSTTSNLLHRYSIKNHLNTVLTKKSNNYWILGSASEVIPLPKGEYFNILDLDTFYNKALYQKVVPHAKFYLAIMREPVSRYIPFEFDGSFHGGIFRRDKSQVYMFEDPNAGDQRSLLQQMSNEFGLSTSSRFDDKLIKSHLETIDKEFSFVIIREYFDESFILLRRRLCWRMQDVLYIRMNTNLKKKPSPITPSGREKLEKLLKADVIFYNHFKNKLFKSIHELGVGFLHEVSHYRRVLKLVRDYCVHGKDMWPNLDIEASVWNDKFSVSKEDCELMLLVEAPMVKMMTEKAMARYQASLKPQDSKS